MIRRLLLCAALLVLMAAPAVAQTDVPNPPGTTKLVWDHDGLNVTAWKLQIDAEPWTTITPTPPANADGLGWWVAFPALTPGQHSLKVSACNIAGCGVSDPLVVNVLVIPTKPTGLRVQLSGGGS